MGFRSRLWRKGELVQSDFGLSELDRNLVDEDSLAWFDVCLADEHGNQLLEQLARELRFDKHHVEDAVAPGERPKAARYGDHTFISVYAVDLERQPDPNDSRLVHSRISAFVLPHGMVTVRTDDRFDMDEVLRRWDQDPELLVEAGVGALVHGLLDVVVDGHFEVIQKLDDAIEELEDALFEEQRRGNQVQRDTYRLRKELVELRRVVTPMREVVNVVMRPSERTMDHEGILQGYFEDLYDHVLRASEWTESLRDMVGSVFETNLSLQDARMNNVMKKLAGWAAVIAVPTAVTGWFGQNVPYPGFSTVFGFWQSVVFILVGTVGLYLLLRRKDWI